MNQTLLVCLLLLATFQLSLCHVCLIHPAQRGGFDVSEPASSTCFQPAAPCGTKPPGSPTATLVAGTTYTILLQQNLNHYNPGWPGFLDVAYSVGNNQTSDSQFTVLQQIPDYWPHLQAQQTNYSVSFIVPDIDCPVCTLRVRYNPNKPTEPIFHNCADITIVKPNTLPTIKGSVVALGYYGPQNTANQYSTFVEVSPYTGEITVLDNTLRVAQRSAVPSRSARKQTNNWMSQGLITSVSSEQKVYYIGDNDNENTNEAPSSLFSLTANGVLAGPTPIARPSSIQQWCGIAATQLPSGAPFVLFGMSEVSGGFTYSVYWLYENGTISDVIATTEVQTLYVNTFFVEFSACKNQAYLLAGHENSLYSLEVGLFTFDMPSRQVVFVNIDNSQYTIQEIHVASDCSSNYLYSLSPGLFSESSNNNHNQSWSLITIDPTSGNILKGVPVTQYGDFTGYYGGSVYGPLTSENQLLHVFTREIDNALMLTVIDVFSAQVEFSTYLDLGEVINVLNLNSLVFLSN